MKNNKNSADYFILFLFGIAGILIYGIQLIYPSSQPNPREITLYTVLELIISISFGWILQRIDSRKQYQENLRQFALSAYRRISDIEKSVNRMRNTIEAKRINYPQDKIHELDVLEIVAEELANTVSSSILDWVDIIGNEISKKERIESLQIEQQKLINTKPRGDETLRQLEEVQREINSLKSDLPLLLQRDISINSDAEGWKPNNVITDYMKQSKINSFIRINVTLFHFDKSINLETIRQGSPYAVELRHGDVNFAAIVTDKDGNLIGEIENPYPELKHYEFITGLISGLNAVINLNGLSNQIRMREPLILTNASISNLNENYMELLIPAKQDNFVGG